MKKHIATNLVPDLLGLDAPRIWDTERAFEHLHASGQADTKRTAERRLISLGMLPAELTATSLADEHHQAANRLVVDWAHLDE